MGLMALQKCQIKSCSVRFVDKDPDLTSVLVYCMFLKPQALGLLVVENKGHYQQALVFLEAGCTDQNAFD